MTKQSNRYFRYYTYIKPIANIPIVKNYSPIIFTLVTLIVFIFFAIKPTVETITVLQKKLVNAQEVLNKVNKKAESLSLGKENYEQLNPDIKSKIQAAVPDDVALKSLIQTLEKNALQNEASISALQIQPVVIEAKAESPAGKLSELNFIFNIEGQYLNLVSLLQDLETGARLISVDNVVINKLDQSQTLLMSITGKAYYLK